MVIASSRDQEQLRADLGRWLTRVHPGEAPVVTDLATPPNTGMSSETVLFTVEVGPEGNRVAEEYVARIEPQQSDLPVFPEYDLDLQYRAMALVAERSDVPVPDLHWYEPDPAVLGNPFFVMARMDGEAVSDNPPYVFGGWLVDADPADRRRLQDNLVDVLARLHAIDLTGVDTTFLERPEHGADPLAQHLGYQRWYYDWAREGRDFRVIDRALAWLEAERPDRSDTVLNWGDARIGNVLWKDFEPVAVLDWEMAALGPPEVDLAWSVHIHDFFAAIGDKMEVPPIEGFLRREDVVAAYEERSGRTVADYDWFEVFAAVRYAIVSIRAGAASVRKGDMPEPEHHDGLIMNAELLDAMLDRLGG